MGILVSWLAVGVLWMMGEIRREFYMCMVKCISAIIPMCLKRCLKMLLSTAIETHGVVSVGDMLSPKHVAIAVIFICLS